MPQHPMSARVVGGVAAQVHPYVLPCSDANWVIEPEPQYSLMSLAILHTSVQPVTKSFGGTALPSFCICANMLLQLSAEKPAPFAATLARCKVAPCTPSTNAATNPRRNIACELVCCNVAGQVRAL